MGKRNETIAYGFRWIFRTVAVDDNLIRQAVKPGASWVDYSLRIGIKEGTIYDGHIV
jgi:hypothetical protein